MITLVLVLRRSIENRSIYISASNVPNTNKTSSSVRSTLLPETRDQKDAKSVQIRFVNKSTPKIVDNSCSVNITCFCTD